MPLVWRCYRVAATLKLKCSALIFLRTAVILRDKLPNLEVVVPLVNSKRREQFERIKAEIAPDLSVHLLDGKARVAMIASDAALLASGTAALECMLAKCPMVVGYRMKPFTFWLAERLVKTPYVSLPNLLAGEELVTELLQQECQPQNSLVHFAVATRW